MVALVAVAVCVLGFFGGRAVRQLAEEPAVTASSSPSRPPTTPSAVSAATSEPSTETADAGLPASSAKVTALLAPYLRARALGSLVGAYVADGPSGAVLDNRLGDRGFAPASTAKLTTAVALLSVARPDERFTTVAETGATPGQVVLVGGGDPTLSAARLGSVAGWIRPLRATTRGPGPSSILRWRAISTGRFPAFSMAAFILVPIPILPNANNDHLAPPKICLP